MSLLDDNHAGPAITGIALSILIIALPITALYLDHRDEEATAQEIKAGTCPIRATTPCGEDVCEYTAKVPCDALEKLIKSTKEEIDD